MPEKQLAVDEAVYEMVNREASKMEDTLKETAERVIRETLDEEKGQTEEGQPKVDEELTKLEDEMSNMREQVMDNTKRISELENNVTGSWSQ